MVVDDISGKSLKQLISYRTDIYFDSANKNFLIQTYTKQTAIKKAGVKKCTPALGLRIKDRIFVAF